MNTRRIIITTLFAGIALAPLCALAQVFVPLAATPNNSAFGNLYTNTTPGDLSTYLNIVFRIALSLGAMAAVLRLVYAGYMYMGEGMWSSKAKAKGIIGEVVLGLFLLLAVYLILRQINPNILNLKITIPNTPTTTAQPVTPAAPAQTPAAPVITPNASPSNCLPGDTACLQGIVPAGGS